MVLLNQSIFPQQKKKILAIAEENIDRRDPGDFNQAMMEFGAMVCLPSNPDCSSCIFRKKCIAFSNKSVNEIPARNSKAAIRHRFIHYLVLTITDRGGEFIYLNKRTGNDIWKNLYDFPSLERTSDNKGNKLPEQEFDVLLKPQAPLFLEVSEQYIHLLTHQKLHARFYRFHSDKMIELPYMLIPLNEIYKYPLPKLIDRYFSQNF